MWKDRKDAARLEGCNSVMYVREFYTGLIFCNVTCYRGVAEIKDRSVKHHLL